MNYLFNFEQYKKRLNKKSKDSYLIMFVIIVLLLGLSMCFQPKPKTTDFYFISAGKFSTYKQAATLSEEIQQRNGAGYIYYNESYHVLVSCYLKNKDAKNVLNNIKPDYPNSYCITLSIKNFNDMKNLTKAQNTAIKDVINTCEKLISNLQTYSIDYKENNLIKIKSDINVLFEKFIKDKDNFYNQFPNNSKFNVCKESLENINECINILLSDTGINNYKTYLMYNTINLVIELNNFTSNF